MTWREYLKGVKCFLFCLKYIIQICLKICFFSPWFASNAICLFFSNVPACTVASFNRVPLRTDVVDFLGSSFRYIDLTAIRMSVTGHNVTTEGEVGFPAERLTLYGLRYE